MTPLEALALVGASVAAGAINTAAGGGSLITFPTLVALGLADRVANVTNTVGLVPGYLGGSLGYRSELAGQGHRVRALAADAVLGACIGVAILLSTPSRAFKVVVPFLVAAACVLLLVQPRLAASLKRRDEANALNRADSAAQRGAAAPPVVPLRLHVLVLLGAIYGAYFGAALGVILLAVFGLLLDEDVQRINALKGFISLLINLVAAIGYAAFADVNWAAAGLVAVGSVVGGFGGASVARRIPGQLLRRSVAVAGLVVAMVLLVRL